MRKILSIVIIISLIISQTFSPALANDYASGTNPNPIAVDPDSVVNMTDAPCIVTLNDNVNLENIAGVTTAVNGGGKLIMTNSNIIGPVGVALFRLGEVEVLNTGNSVLASDTFVNLVDLQGDSQLIVGVPLIFPANLTSSTGVAFGGEGSKLTISGVATIGAVTNYSTVAGNGELNLYSDGNVIATVGAAAAAERFGTLAAVGTTNVGNTYATETALGAAVTFTGLLNSTNIYVQTNAASTVAGALTASTVEFDDVGSIAVTGTSTITTGVTNGSGTDGQGTLQLIGAGNTITGDVGAAGAGIALLNIDGTTATTGNVYSTQIDVAAVTTLGDALADATVTNTLNLQHAGLTTISGILDSVNGTTGTNIAFSLANGALDINSNANIAGATTTAADRGDIELKGAGSTTVRGDIGAAVLHLDVFNITGAGTFTLNGGIFANTITMNNAAGTAIIGASNNHACTDLNLTAGNLNLGAFTTTLTAGNYTQGPAGTLRTTIQNTTTAGNIVTPGTVTIAAGSNLAVTTPGLYIPNNTSWTIINGTAAAGAINVPTITSNSAVLTFSGTAADGGRDLMITALRTNSYNSPNIAPNPNAAAVGAALEAAGAAGATGDMLYVLNTLDSLSAAQIGAALNTLVPEIDAGVINTTTTVLNNFVGVAMDRLEEILKLAQGGGDSAGTGISTGDANKLTGVWGKGYGSYLTQGTRNNIQGYDAWNAGTALGVDHLFSDCVTFGISGGYAYGNVDSDVNSANTYINSAQATIYTGYQDPNHPYFVDMAGVFAWNWYDGKRDINIGNVILRTANSSYEGQQYGAYIGGGYRFNLTKNIEFTPLVSLQWNHLRLGSYTETEAGALSLSVDSKNYDQLQSGLGAKIASPMQCKWGTLTPEIRGKWFYDFIGDDMVVASNFTGGGPSFDANGCKPALNSFNAGGQLKFEFKNDISILADCDTEMKDQFFGIYGSVTCRYDF